MRRQQGAFNMYMTVNQAGHNVLALSVDFLLPAIIAETDDNPLGNGDVRFHNFTGKDINYFGVFNDQLCGDLFGASLNSRA